MDLIFSLFLNKNDYSCCFYCEKQFTYESGIALTRTRDHIVPMDRGGLKGMKSHNVVFCCWRCNQQKGNLLLHEWVKKLKANNSLHSKKVMPIVLENISMLRLIINKYPEYFYHPDSLL